MREVGDINNILYLNWYKKNLVLDAEIFSHVVFIPESFNLSSFHLYFFLYLFLEVDMRNKIFPVEVPHLHVREVPKALSRCGPQMGSGLPLDVRLIPGHIITGFQ